MKAKRQNRASVSGTIVDGFGGHVTPNMSLVAVKARWQSCRLAGASDPPNRPILKMPLTAKPVLVPEEPVVYSYHSVYFWCTFLYHFSHHG